MPDDTSTKSGALLVGLFAVALGLVHVSAAEANRVAVLSAIDAADVSGQLEARMVRQETLLANANMPGLDRDVRGNELAEAMALRQGDKNGNGIIQLQQRGQIARDRARDAGGRAKAYGTAEGAFQLAILLLAVAFANGDRRLRMGAVALAGVGVVLAVLAGLGLAL